MLHVTDDCYTEHTEWLVCFKWFISQRIFLLVTTAAAAAANAARCYCC